MLSFPIFWVNSNMTNIIRMNYLIFNFSFLNVGLHMLIVLLTKKLESSFEIPTQFKLRVRINPRQLRAVLLESFEHTAWKMCISAKVRNCHDFSTRGDECINIGHQTLRGVFWIKNHPWLISLNDLPSTDSVESCVF